MPEKYDNTGIRLFALAWEVFVGVPVLVLFVSWVRGSNSFGWLHFVGLFGVILVQSVAASALSYQDTRLALFIDRAFVVRLGILLVGIVLVGLMAYLLTLSPGSPPK